jgi:ELWxxDGT repeat protein
MSVVTSLVADIHAGGADSAPHDLVAVNAITIKGLTASPGRVYFGANDGTHGDELWASDGTAPGTVLVKDINPHLPPSPDVPAASSDPHFLTAVGRRVFFAADDGSDGTELWKSDGTAAGTVLVKDINPLGGADPHDLTAVGNKLFFTADDGTHGRELWVTDGTSVGTKLVKDLAAGPSGPGLADLTNVGGTLLFVVQNGPNAGLWRSDGTGAGTTRVSTLDVWTPGGLTAVGSKAFFSVATASGGTLYQVDQNLTHVTKVASLPDVAIGMTAFKGQVYFTTYTGSAGFAGELWHSDGTAQGTGVVKVVSAPFDSTAMIAEFTAAGGALYFTANSYIHGLELWKSDGTAAGTVRVKQLLKDNFISEHYLTASGLPGAPLVFNVNDGVHGDKLWSSDGTAAGTHRVSDLDPGTANLYPDAPVSVLLGAGAPAVFFSATDGTHGRELWDAFALQVALPPGSGNVIGPPGGQYYAAAFSDGHSPGRDRAAMDVLLADVERRGVNSLIGLLVPPDTGRPGLIGLLFAPVTYPDHQNLGPRVGGGDTALIGLLLPPDRALDGHTALFGLGEDSALIGLLFPPP